MTEPISPIQASPFAGGFASYEKLALARFRLDRLKQPWSQTDSALNISLLKPAWHVGWVLAPMKMQAGMHGCKHPSYEKVAPGAAAKDRGQRRSANSLEPPAN